MTQPGLEDLSPDSDSSPDSSAHFDGLIPDLDMIDSDFDFDSDVGTRGTRSRELSECSKIKLILIRINFIKDFFQFDNPVHNGSNSRKMHFVSI